jgi:hypothetical protein
MLSNEFLREIHAAWLPNVNDDGLNRVIDLLEKGSPLLLAGRFTSAVPTGCLATHIAWHHPAVCHRTEDAGILWLTRVAGLNPATSHVIREWDRHDPREWAFRNDLLTVLLAERVRRSEAVAPVEHDELVTA